MEAEAEVEVEVEAYARIRVRKDPPSPSFDRPTGTTVASKCSDQYLGSGGVTDAGDPAK